MRLPVMEIDPQNAVLRPHAVQHHIVNSLALKLFIKGTLKPGYFAGGFYGGGAIRNLPVFRSRWSAGHVV